MVRYVLASVLVLLLAAPVGATVYETNGTDPDITITLTIGCYTNVYWNNTDADHNIYFNDTVQNGSNTGDWFRDRSGGVRGAYGAATKSSQDAWADGYYESYDAAFFWLQSNCHVDWTVTPSGDLTSSTDALPTWFTIAFTNNTGGGGGFINNDTRQTCGTIPLDGAGTYAQDSNSDGVMTLFSCTDDGGGNAFYPDQWPFPMTGGPYTTTAHSFSPFCEGTILFHARAERSALQDDAGTYTATINMAFSETSP
jgi:hypothetical protein